MPVVPAAELDDAGVMTVVVVVEEEFVVVVVLVEGEPEEEAELVEEGAGAEAGGREPADVPCATPCTVTAGT